MSRKRYNTEFKQQAVKLISEQGYSVADAARHLGVATKSLYDWREQLEESQASYNQPEKDELKALRKQVKSLEMDNAYPELESGIICISLDLI